VPTASITERLASNGMQQHLYAEPVTAAECLQDPCLFDIDCSCGLVCEWFNCEHG
jgi:hypothetical protein